MMGWSSWNSFRINISESLINSAADSMVSKGLFAAGYNYVDIDDGFFGGRDSDGRLYWNGNFPNGLAPIVQHVHQLGMKIGIYSDAGDNLCSTTWDNNPHGRGVGLWQHEEADCRLFFDELDFDFFKVDFCGGLNIKKSAKELYTNIYRHLRNCKRQDIRFNICRWQFPGTWAINFADSWRIDDDISREFRRIDEIIRKDLYLGAYSSPGHYNDMDILEVGRGMQNEEAKTHFGMWSILESPLIIGCDVRYISDSTLNLLLNKEVIALNQDPLGLQAQVVKQDDDVIIVAKDIKKMYSTTRAMAVYNRSEKPQHVFCSFADLLLGGKVKVRDLWQHCPVATSEKGFYVDVPRHGCALFTLKGSKRLDATVYEAEQSYLNDYSPESPQSAAVFPCKDASNGHIVKNLGGNATNWCRFPAIHVAHGGNYVLRLYGYNQEAGTINYSINKFSGEMQVEKQATRAKFMKEIKVTLKKGDNALIISVAQGTSPDFDKIEILPL
ncbi:MAG: alpha-galactosidase [Muribaculaceae bacterium]|nr:alpha-galactosidase [Muribaculaceae bacterium]